MARLIDEGYEIPDFKEPPELTEAALPYWQAFSILNPSRSSNGFGAGNIPLSEIKAYLDLMGIVDPEEVADHVRFIRAMDREYLSQHRSSD